MGSKTLVFVGLLLAMVLLISSQVAARQLDKTLHTAMNLASGWNMRPRRGYGNGRRGSPCIGPGCGSPGGSTPGSIGGPGGPEGPRFGFEGRCSHGCCGQYVADRCNHCCI